MPDIVATVISPDQFEGRGEVGPFPIEQMSKRCLAQGDSWFTLGGVPPWITTNLLSQMVFSLSACIVNCALPGKQLAHMVDTTTHRRFLQLLRGRAASKWDLILLSGGGNDLIDAALSPPTATGANRLLLTSAEWSAAAPPPARYQSAEGWSTFSTHIEAVFDQFLAERDKGVNASTPVVLHSYDVAVPRNAGGGFGIGPWLHKAFNMYAIPLEHRVDLAVALLTGLRDLLAAIVAARPAANVALVETLGTLTRAAVVEGESGDWENEIHPTRNGYRLLAQRWRPEVEARW
jgi:lysophospholipase L1-like esterase